MAEIIASSPKGNGIRKPTSAYIPIPTAIKVLTKILPNQILCSLKEFHNEFLEKRISREQLVKRFRQLVGDKILIALVQAYDNKKAAVAQKK